MEFINPDKQYEKETKEYCSKQDIAALSNDYSTAEVSDFQHTIDNSFLESSYGKTCDTMRQRGYQILGLCSNAPWYHGNCYSAVVFEDTRNYDIFWCHINDTITNWWKGQANV